MNHQKLTKWSVITGTLGVVAYLLALFAFWGGTTWSGFDHKDFYAAGSGLLYIAIWLKLGAIYHKGS